MRLKITHHTLRNTLVLAVVLTSVTFFGWQAIKQTSHAADIRNFDPGNIMSDAVMSNKSTMSVQDIQNFLNSKNYCDNKDTYKATWYPNLQYNIKDGKFVCMARESFNGESAAQIIWQAGQDYNINPQVLIVMLEKEQGLVSDTWPNSVQYRTAMGYGCPDTAPCDTQYYGLENQVRLAANLLRTVLDGGWSNYPVGQRYVQYHPNTSCGGSIINIQNRATSALYRYTPYQPNQSALNAGYGTGDSCSAYGNRNFWRLFTDWFGSTNGPFKWQTMSESRVLVLKSDQYKIYPDTQLHDSYLVGKQVEVFFSSKTDLSDGTPCLRTRIDTQNKVPRCIPMTHLNEFRPVFTTLEEGQRTKTFTRSACRLWFATDRIDCAFSQYMATNRHIKVAAKTQIMGSTFYVTENDYKDGNLKNRGIREDALADSAAYTEIEPVYLRSTKETTKISSAGIQVEESPVRMDDISLYVSSSVIGDKTFYRSQYDENRGQDLLVDSSVLDTNLFYPFVMPRTLETKNVTGGTKSEDFLTGKVCAILKTGVHLKFVTKTKFNGVDYFRTEHSTNTESNCAIKASSLSEV